MLSASPWSDNSQPREPNTLPAMGADGGSTQRPVGDNRLPGGMANGLIKGAAGGVQQASFSDSAAVAKSAAGSALPSEPPNSSSGAAPSTAQFRHIEQRLRELGATYYLLETWGPGGDQYRFFCRMAIAGNSDYGRNRIFQNTDSDPLRAMLSVLDQAEQWRSGRQP
jgi:hypothetical protein